MTAATTRTVPAAAAVAPSVSPGLHRLTPLLGELSDLKRVRVAGRPGSLAEQAFRRGWRRLVAGEPVVRFVGARSRTAILDLISPYLPIRA